MIIVFLDSTITIIERMYHYNYYPKPRLTGQKLYSLIYDNYICSPNEKKIKI